MITNVFSKLGFTLGYVRQQDVQSQFDGKITMQCYSLVYIKKQCTYHRIGRK